MPTQAKFKTTAKVIVTCEQCSKLYTYEHYFYAYGRLIDENAAINLARQNMDKVFDHYSRQIAGGNFSSIVENMACPECGSLQSWMIEPLRKRRGWKLGLIWAAIMFLVAIPVSFVLNALINNPVVGVLSLMLIFVLPICILFIVRAWAMKNFMSARGKPLADSDKQPVVELHKGLIAETHLTL
jgi:hypothetical protein